MKHKSVIFDLDGTLLDTLGDLADSMNAVLKHANYPMHARESYRYFVGDGIRKLVERTLPETDRNQIMIDKCLARFREEYTNNWDATTAPYEGVVDMLDALSGMGVSKAVLSNKPHESVLECVERYFRESDFDVIQGVCEAVPPKPDTAGAMSVVNRLGVTPSDVIYVGDTDTDMQTAVAAGFFAVGATWGFRTPEELCQHGASLLVNYPMELLEIWA